MDLLADFLNYVKIDTQSDEESLSTPSTKKQYDLLRFLQNELTSLNVENQLDEYGRLYAYVPGNSELDCIGLCAHVDTALEASGKNVKPQIIKDYDLSDIKLGDSSLVLSPKDYPHLRQCYKKTIITTDGNTLLGADDKAGVAIIMDVLRKVLSLDESIRRPLSILFTPDEEIGRGPEHFSLEKFKAKYAYTIDGASPKKISFENFNAKAITVSIIGRSIHPGEGKGKLLNASLIMNEFIALLPSKMTPFYTANKEGFNHLVSINGDVENCVANFILRNHDSSLLDKQVNDFEDAKKMIEEKYPGVKVKLNIKDQYKNMIEVLNKRPEAKNHIVQIYQKLNIPFQEEATRGGTDGATFSFLGCPCPNLGTGSYNHHGRYEYAVKEEMELMSEIVFELFKN